MEATITSHYLAHKLLELEDLPIYINVIKDPSTFQIQPDGQSWDADSELCVLDPDDVEKGPNAIIFVVELTHWEEEMEHLNDKG